MLEDLKSPLKAIALSIVLGVAYYSIILGRFALDAYLKGFKNYFETFSMGMDALPLFGIGMLLNYLIQAWPYTIFMISALWLLIKFIFN